jgi:histidinol dehydrogenase
MTRLDHVLAAQGPLERLDPVRRARLLARSSAEDPEFRDAVARIVARVRTDGDAALRDLAREHDGVEVDDLQVPPADLFEALDRTAPGLRKALERAAANLEAVHRAGLPHDTRVQVEPGVVVGRRPDPLARAGIYAPGGRAVYPSSVLMTAIPARIAGVAEIVLCSPPGAGGRPAATILAAAALAGVHRVFAIGGAGAIAAMAFGTETVPRVDRVFGPGNAWVTEAKLQVAPLVGIDIPAGPSELLVLADAAADPDFVAREMVAQAEHDPRAAVVAVVFGRDAGGSAARLRIALFRRAEAAERRAIVLESLAARGALLTAVDAGAALEFAHDYAPEHLLLATADAADLLPRVRNAGTVFFGDGASNALGDYLTGANHVLPTGGLARCYSGLSTHDFVRWTTWQEVTTRGASSLAGDAFEIASAEGLAAHAEAARALLRPGPGADPERVALPPRRAGLDRLTLYRSVDPGLLDLASNHNLFGVPPAAAAALAHFESAGIARYPSASNDELRAALATLHDVPLASIVTGCGSDDVLDATLRAFGVAAERVAYPAPTFVMAAHFATTNGLLPMAIPPRADGEPDLDALIAARAAITYLCSPNNPTGSLLSRGALDRILEATRGLVILDEAYGDFSGTSNATLAAGHGRLLVLRTMSKAFGLAGMRVGWGIGAPALVQAVECARGPYRVSAPAEAAALAVLRHDLPWVRARVADAVSCRVRLCAALAAAGFAPLPSHANFLLVPVADAAGAARALRERGIAVRAFGSLPGVGDALRITVAPWPLLEPAIATIVAVARPGEPATVEAR